MTGGESGLCQVVLIQEIKDEECEGRINSATLSKWRGDEHNKTNKFLKTNHLNAPSMREVKMAKLLRCNYKVQMSQMVRWAIKDAVVSHHNRKLKKALPLRSLRRRSDMRGHD
jgi:hypothetical protein